MTGSGADGPHQRTPRQGIGSAGPVALPRGATQAILRAAERAGIGVEITTPDGQLGGSLAPSGLDALQGRPACQADASDADDGRTPVRIGVARAASAGQDVEVKLGFRLTAQSTGERALLSTEQGFLRLIEAAPDGVVIVQGGRGAKFRIAYANPSAVRGAGYASLEEFLSVPAIEHIHPDDAESLATGWQAMFEGRQETHRQELRILRRDGGHIAQDTVSMLADWDDQPGVLIMARDVSARRQLQTQLVQADRLAAAGTLAAGVAHEINNPLAYVLLNLQYLLRELPRMGADRQRLEQLLGRLREAHHGAQRVSSIVRDLRDFSAPDEQQLGPVDLKRVLGAALKVAGSQLEDRARVLEEYDSVPPVQGNAARLEQVFLNLLVNAAHALVPERAEHNQIRVRLRADGATRVVAEIADNGAGIATDLLGRVFDPFFTTKPADVGTGLGLPICHSIISNLGGEITVDSQLGRGTVFRVTLPTCPKTPKPRTATPFPFAAPNSPRVRVLVVDDELPVAAMLSKLLGREYHVRVTTSGREALDLLLGPERFDVVLCDLLMPGMSGMDLHRQLAEQRPGLEERIVFMTGGAFTPRAGEFLAKVGNPRIEKPFDLNEVRRMVRKLGGHSAPNG